MNHPIFVSIFQSFSEAGDSSHTALRLAALRQQLRARELDGFIAPRADAHQNEYVPPGDERLAFLTGFTGSAGVVVVLAETAAIFVDGRYGLQVREQVDQTLFAPQDLLACPPSRWLARHVSKNARIGYDPWLHTPAQIQVLRSALEGVGAVLVALDANPIDAVWPDRPAEPSAPVTLYPEKYAGEKASVKLARIAQALQDSDGLLVSDPHAVAWAFNIRGGDVAHTPLPLAWALIPREGRPRLYIDSKKLSPLVRENLEELAELPAPGALESDLAAWAGAGRRLTFDHATAPDKLVALYRDAGGAAHLAADPIALMKARKNAAELRGARAAHLRDGAALVEFLAWFDRQAPRGELTEIKAAEALETFRRATGKLAEISFPTISAFGPHAALPHYRVVEASDARIEHGLYLVDSGAQYIDGTTDVTRTLGVGRCLSEWRDRYTRVLKGHIAIATAVFPAGVAGAQIDAFARRPLWEAGLDFDHGTGHGVGAYLSVHEGPQRISKLGHAPLEPGMILSNEPGYYKAGAYGVRLENLVIVVPRQIPGAEREMLGFETITLAPFDRRLIEKKLMTTPEIAWLDAYHERVCKLLTPKISARTRNWLKEATAKIG